MKVEFEIPAHLQILRINIELDVFNACMTLSEMEYLIDSDSIGVVHRSIIQQKMKLSGQKWSIDGTNAVANLHCYRKSRAWTKVLNLIKIYAA